MKKCILFLFVLLLSPTLRAQQQFTMEEAVLGMSGKFSPEQLKQIRWIPGEDKYTHIVGTGKQQALICTEVPSFSVDTLLRISQIATFLNEPLEKFPEVNWFSNQSGYFSFKNQYYLLKNSGKKWDITTWTGSNHQLPEGAENVTIDDKQLQLAFTQDNNIKLLKSNGQLISVTSDSTEHIVNGQSVHRNEFGIDRGLFFSPKGNLLAYYRMDERGVADYPIIDWNTIPAQSKNIKYPMSGQTSHVVSIGVFDPATSKTIFLQTGEPLDHYLTCVTWAPDEKSIFVAILNRAQNHLKLNQYSSQSGKLIKTLFEEKDEKYVEPQHSLNFLPGTNNEFLWWSQRDGYMHLYRYNTDGKLLNQVTKGDWLVNELIGFDPSDKTIIITATKESPLEKHLYKVNWKNSSITRLGQAAGLHKGILNSKGNYLIDVYSSSNIPNNTELINTKNAQLIRSLSQAKNKLEGYELARVKPLQLTAEDGTKLYGKLMFPSHFDSSKTYPVIVYLYNGPHVQLVRNSYPASGNLWYDYLTQRGYFVFVMDGRGSSNRGLEFEQATFRKLGTIEMEDQLKGVAYLKSLPYIDSSRMGVHGWSFGGFMATSLMLRHPGVFSCAVAGGPVIDWRLYEVMYTERYMDTPEENPIGYANNNLMSEIDHLDGDLLIIHGAQDDVVVWQHTMNFIRTAIKEGVQLDYFVYPGHPHNVRGKDRVHLMQKITDYFDQHLKNKTK